MSKRTVVYEEGWAIVIGHDVMSTNRVYHIYIDKDVAERAIRKLVKRTGYKYKLKPVVIEVVK